MAKTALLSTEQPGKIIESCRKLVALQWKLIATRETVEALRKEGIPVTDVKQFTGVGYEYGIPPTLHPKIEKALTEDCEERIDLVFDVPYSLPRGNDVGGRTLLALGAKGKRLVLNNRPDLEKVVQLLEKEPSAIEALRAQLIAAVNYEIAGHFLLLAKENSEQYEGLLARHSLACSEGENPYQESCDLFAFPAEDPLAISRLSHRSRERICFTNLADVDSILVTMEKLKQAFALNCGKLPHIAVAAKHGNPCGIGVDWTSKARAVTRALGGNPQAIWGGEVILNFAVDEELARVLSEDPERKEEYGSAAWMLDVVIAPSFSRDALSLLGKRKQRILLSNPAIGEEDAAPPKWHYRFVRGGFLRQPPAGYVLRLDDLDWIASPNDREALLIAWAASFTSFHGGNEVSLARDAMLIGVGGGPSTVMAAQHAVQWAKSYGQEIEGSVFCADAFFPFTDAPEILVRAGCKTGVVPAGGSQHEAVRRYFADKAVAVGFIPGQFRGFCRH